MNLFTVIKAPIPLISATTTDLVYLEAVLKEIYGGQVIEYKEGQTLARSTLYYSVGGVRNKPQDLYKEFIKAESKLIVINPEAQDSIYFDVGQIPTPRDLLYEELSRFISENDFKEILPALGGLTMKDSIELLMITQADHGYMDSNTVMRTRLQYYNSTQGLDIVDTELKGYIPDENLADFAEYEREFFLEDHDQRLRPRGLIIHGVPGTGKSQGAKFLAREWRVPLFRLDATIQSKWLGQSEANLAQALRQIEQHKPAILLIDEAEKLFSTGSDSGVSEKLLATMLWWMQEHKARVFTYMTCNDLNRLPRELQRPGRIDTLFEFEALDQEDATGLSAEIIKSFDTEIKVHHKGWGTMTGAEVYQRTLQAIKDSIKIDRVQKKSKKP